MSPGMGLVTKSRMRVWATRMLDRGQCEDHAIGCHEQPAHVIAPDFEAAASDAGDDIIVEAVLVAQRAEALHAGHLVARRAVILGQLRLDDHGRVEFIRDDEVRRLVEAGDSLRPLGLR